MRRQSGVKMHDDLTSARPPPPRAHLDSSFVVTLELEHTLHDGSNRLLLILAQSHSVDILDEGIRRSE